MKIEKRLYLILLIAILLIPTGCKKLRKPEKPQGPAFSIMTYNVNYGGYRADLALDIILKTQPDVVCLQETNDKWEKILVPQLSKIYPHYKFRHYSGAGGMAIFTKFDFQDVAYIPPDNSWFPAWIVNVDSPLGKVQVMMVHLHPALSDKGGFKVSSYFSTKDTRLREITGYYPHLKKDLPTIVLGDYNEKESDKAMTWLRKQGFTNALSEFDNKSHTWRWRGRMISLKKRFDHIMYSKPLYACAAKVIYAGASDHFPVIALIENCPTPQK